MPEESPAHASRSNGNVEHANQQVQGMVRTYRDALESRHEMKIDGHHHTIPWMIRRTAATLAIFKTVWAVDHHWKGSKARTPGKEQGEFGDG